MSRDRDPARFLRSGLRANAAFSGLSGAALLAAPAPIAALLGAGPPARVAGAGVSLCVFAALLVGPATREVVRPSPAAAVVAADLAWVAASALLLPANVFRGAGNGQVAIVAGVVLAFALLQWLGLRRMRQYARTAAP